MDKALIQDSQVSESDKGKIQDDIIKSIQSKNNSSGKESKPITDGHRNDSSSRTSIEGYEHLSEDKEIDVDKEICTKKKNGQFISNNGGSERLRFILRENNEKNFIYALAEKYRNKSVTDGHHGGSLVPKQRHGSVYFKSKTYMDTYSALEGTEMPSTILDTTVFQKKDCLRQINKDVTSYLDKCSWHEASEQVSNDEGSLSNEDNDTVKAELSTSDTFSKEVEDLASESSGPYSEEISIVQTSGESVSGNEDTEDSSTDDDCESVIDENVEDSMFLVHNDEQQALVPVFIIHVVEDDVILDQHLALVDNEDAFIEEGSCYDETNDGLSEADQPEVASQQNRLVMPSFYDFYEATTPTDYSTKHHMLTNNGYNVEMAGDALVVVNNVQIPQLPDCVNPVQPRLQDLDGADQEPYQADHLRDNSTDQTDSVVQDEDVFMFTLSLSVSLEAPQVMEESPIHSFSASSENSQWSILGGGQEEMSDFTDTESEDDEQSVYSLSSLSDHDLALNVDDLSEQLDIS